MIRRLIQATLCLLAFSQSALAQDGIDPAKKAAIQELMAITGAEANRQQLTHTFTQQLITVLQANGISINEQTTRIIRDEVKTVVDEQLENQRLQEEAAAAGGEVNSLLCAYRFRDSNHTDGLSVYDHWLRWGGIESDFEGFTDKHADWIRTLPAMVLRDDTLMIHADAMLYVNHGLTIDAVNESFRQLMDSYDLPRWMSTLASFGEHMAFSGLDITGSKRAEQLLSLYGGSLLVHGHTPIPFARQIDAETVTEAWSYAGGRCLNVDGGMYMGSPGFVHRL